MLLFDRACPLSALQQRGLSFQAPGEDNGSQVKLVEPCPGCFPCQLPPSYLFYQMSACHRRGEREKQKVFFTSNKKANFAGLEFAGNGCGHGHGNGYEMTEALRRKGMARTRSFERQIRAGLSKLQAMNFF